MGRKVNLTSIRRCEIVTNLTNGTDVLFDMENLKSVLVEKNKCIKDYCYIIHDKDTYSEKEVKNKQNCKVGELKAPHIHLLLRFEEKQPQKLECVAEWFGVKSNFVNKIRGRWEDACLYQIHKNAPDKFQYSSNEVVCNFNYQELLDKYDKSEGIQGILQKILNGEICEYNKTIEIDNLTLVMHSRLINEAFKVRAEHLQATRKDRDMKCIFITGTSQSGKTTLARKIAEHHKLAYFISSATNDILFGYKQEPCIILDELRPSSLELCNLLKLLDNNVASSAKSRYRNQMVYADLIIITSILDIDTFYSNVFKDSDEPIVQLKRRCGMYIKMDRANICASIWDSKAMKYTQAAIYKNTILKEFIPKENKTTDDVHACVSTLIPFLKSKEESDFESLSDCEQITLPFDFD